MKKFLVLAASLVVANLPTAAQSAEAAKVPTVVVPGIKTGDYEAKLDDGSVFAYRLVTEDPVKPGLDVRIVKANPRQTVRFAIPRQRWWRHVDAYSGENWVEFLRDGRNYLTVRPFTPGETVRVTYEFDPDDVPGAKPRPESEKVWSVAFSNGARATFALDDNCQVNLERFWPDHPLCEAATATVSRVIRCEKDETRVFGVAIDWWMTAYLNGREVYTTWPNGNCTDLKSPYGHILRLNLRKGENRLVFKTSPGSDSWDFLCREFPSYDRWPADDAARRRAYDVLFPPVPALRYGPWVTAVSTDRARVGVELTAEGLAGIRLTNPEGKTVTKWTTVYGQKEYRRVHCFALDGLKPATDYAYEIVLLDEAANRERSLARGAFKTFPDAGDTFDFYLFGDTQFNDEGRIAVLDRHVEHGLGKGRFIVSVGDVGNDFDDFSSVYHASFLEYLKGRGVTRPTVLLRGNHEFHGRHTTDFPKHFGRPYYSFTYGDTFFFVIDTGEWARRPRMEMPSYCAEQAAWLAAEVASPACRKARRRVMLAHTVPFACEGKARSKVVSDICADAFFGAAPKCRLDLWLCGDIHAAYRYDPVSGEIAGRNRDAGYPRMGEADLRNVRFPVYVNDGPNCGCAKQTMTHVAFSADAIQVTVCDQRGPVLDRTRLVPGKPVEVLASRWPHVSTVWGGARRRARTDAAK